MARTMLGVDEAQSTPKVVPVRPPTRPSATRPRTSRRFWSIRILTAAIFVLLLCAMANTQFTALSKSRSDLAKRFSVRGTTAAAFVEAYTGFVIGREKTLAESQLSAKHVTDAKFREFLNVFGFGPAVLLDPTGHALDVSPYKATLIGKELGNKYEHLATALSGEPAASNVVASAVQGVPIVALATPFDTPYGQRVVSGAYDLTSQPMGLYMHHVLPYVDGIVYLVDAGDTIIASSSNDAGPLAKFDPELARAIAHSPAGTYRPAFGATRRFATAPVGTTPWRLVLAVPETTLFHPISEADSNVQWAFMGAFALAAGLLLVVFVRNREARAYASRDARTDPLTGIANRRAIQEALNRLLSDRRRSRTEVGVLMIDIDHFKAVNDRIGHGGGDVVLREVVARVESCLRVEDQMGRWGGEEFIVLVANIDAVGLEVVAERIRSCVAGAPITSKRTSTAVTVSIGAAMTADDDDEAVVARADRALYAAKDSGRDRCVVA